MSEISKYIICCLSVLSVLLVSCSTPQTTTKTGREKLVVSENKVLEYVDTQIGTGKSPLLNKKVTLHYRWTLPDGKVLEDSYKSNLPLTFIYGKDEIINGLSEGIKTMKEGGKRTLYIPPELGFGDKTFQEVPANSNIIIEVELIKVD